MKKADAQILVYREFDAWVKRELPEGKEPSGTEALAFYVDLVNQKSPALEFRTRGDPWQTVHAWLLSTHRCSD